MCSPVNLPKETELEQRRHEDHPALVCPRAIITPGSKGTRKVIITEPLCGS